MNTNAFPTKGNLMLAKNSLTLAKQGYELMDKKRNILIRELMNLIEEAKTIQSEIDATFTEAYQALQQANIEVGIHSVQEIAKAIPAEDSVRIKTRSIMGTEIPLVSCEEEKKIPYYGFYNSSESVWAACCTSCVTTMSCAGARTKARSACPTVQSCAAWASPWACSAASRPLAAWCCRVP